MKKFIVFFLFLNFNIANASDWVTGSVFVNKNSAKSPNVVFANSFTGYGLSWNSWQTVDVTSLGIPAKAKSVQLTGLLIITHGTSFEACDLTVAVRFFGSNESEHNYVGQAVETDVNGGQRTNLTTWVPLRNGKFQIYLGKNTKGQWPTNCAYGVNLSAQAFLL